MIDKDDIDTLKHYKVLGNTDTVDYCCWHVGIFNTATATCDQGVSDKNTAYWVGVKEPVPAIDVEKEVTG